MTPHPHESFDSKVVIVHNGIIENSRSLRKHLVSQGIELNSETDSEALAHMIAIELNQDNNPLEAVKKMPEKSAIGTLGLCALFKNTM